MIPDWLNWANAYLTIPIALIGFFVTFKTARKAQKAAMSAEKQVQLVAERFRTIAAIKTVTQLVHIEKSLDSAIETKSRELLRHVVHDWTWQAGAYREYLDGNNSPEVPDTLRTIQASITAATTLKPKIVSFDDDTDWAKQTDSLRRAISKIAAKLGTITTSQALGTGNGQ